MRRPSDWFYFLLLILIAGGGFLFRALQLSERPMHTDEAVHAVKLGELLDAGTYTYNPREFHGPTIYYMALPLVRLSGAASYAEIPSEVPLRLAIAIVGALLILLPVIFLPGLGRTATVSAAVILAVSPAFAFYSRYFIQEIPFVLFTWGAIGACWRYVHRRHRAWAVLAGVCVGLSHATKETAVLTWACAFAAAGLTVIVAHLLEHQHREPHTQIRLRDGLLAAAIALGVALLFLTNLFRNPAAVVDVFRSYYLYMARATTGDGHGTGAGAHLNPWHFYIGLLTWFRQGSGAWFSEAFVLLLALLGACFGIPRRSLHVFNRHLVRFVTLHTVLLATLYALIPYKTPWNLLGFYAGLVLLAGVGAAHLLHTGPRWWKAIVAVLLLTGTAHLAWQAKRACFQFSSDIRNPWVYGHTAPNLLKLAERVEDLATVHPAGVAMPVQILSASDDYWPLPWYLRQLTHVGYYSEVPEEGPAPVVISTEGLAAQVEKRVGGTYQAEFYGLRPDVLILLLISPDLWSRYMEKVTAEAVP